MKILFLTENFPPEVNAAATRVYERACYWQKKGHNVTILTTAPNFPSGIIFKGYKNKWFQKEIMNEITVIRVKTFISANQGFFLRSLDFLSFMFSSIFFGSFLKRPDVIMFTSPQFFTAIAGWFLSLVHRKPYVFELGDLWPESIKGVGLMADSFIYKILTSIEIFLYKKAKIIIPLTVSFKKDLVNRGICEEKIKVVLNAVDLSVYAPRAKDPYILEKYNLENKFIIGYIGTFGMAHDLPKFITTFKEVEKNYPDIFFLLIGDGAEKDKIQKSISIHKVKNIILLPLQPKEKIPDFWSVCDVALVHLKDDLIFKSVIPSKMFEAMGMGIPLLTISPGGESKKIVEENQCGIWVSSSNNEKELIASIEKLYLSPTKNFELKKNSYQSSKKYSREKQAEKIIEILEKAIN